MDEFMELWNTQVDFKTSKSHKRLYGKKSSELGKRAAPMEWEVRLAAKKNAGGASSSAGGEGQPDETPFDSRGGGAAGARQSEKEEKAKKREKEEKTKKRSTPVAAPVLTSKGRFGGTLAARLLGVGT